MPGVAADDGLIAANPARGIEPPQVVRHEQRYLTAAEVATLADAIDPRYRGLVYLGAYGGLRIGEMVGLTVCNVNPLGSTVKVVTQVVEVAGRQTPGPPKTAAGRRTVPLPRFVMDQLAPHLQDKTPDALVFSAPEGGTIRRTIWAARTFRPAVERAGLHSLRVHDLRHTAVALWVAAGASPLELTDEADQAQQRVVRLGPLRAPLRGRVHGHHGPPRRNGETDSKELTMTTHGHLGPGDLGTLERTDLGLGGASRRRGATGDGGGAGALVCWSPAPGAPGVSSRLDPSVLADPPTRDTPPSAA